MASDYVMIQRTHVTKLFTILLSVTLSSVAVKVATVLIVLGAFVQTK